MTHNTGASHPFYGVTHSGSTEGRTGQEYLVSHSGAGQTSAGQTGAEACTRPAARASSSDKFGHNDFGGTGTGARAAGQSGTGTGKSASATAARDTGTGTRGVGQSGAGLSRQASSGIKSSEFLDEPTLLLRSDIPGRGVAKPGRGTEDFWPGPENGASHDEANAQNEGKDTGQSYESDGWHVPDTPDGYNFTLPEGMEVDERAADQFRDLAHAEGITQGQAQSVAGLYAKLVSKQQEDQAEALVETENYWLAELRSDRTFPKTVAQARLAMKRYGSPELENLLNDTRLGSHPALVRFVARIGRELAEPDTMPAKSTRASQGLNFYDTMRS